MSVFQQEIREAFIDSDEAEFRRKSSNPYHELKKGDDLLEWIFCLKCGEEHRPKIVEKIILQREKDIGEELIDENYEEKLEDGTTVYKVRKVRVAILKGIIIEYCEILKCKCNELIYRTFEIYEDRNEPNQKPKIIPIRKDKVAVKNESDDVEFKVIHERYIEAITAYNMSLSYASGVSIRSVLELLCKKRGHFDTILNDRVNGRILSQEQIDGIKRQIGLEEQVKKLIEEVKVKAPNTFDENDIDDVKNMMYWGHRVVHGNVLPDDDELMTSFKIIEEIFQILYFEPAMIKMYEEKRIKRAENLKESNKKFSSYSRR